ncbi:MAG: AlkA N-terminal domain-containing protein [Gammaproteobacteria bacterium]|nr:AlkA N-terminal domain-containing protein [Gammaproteobacteria bacterium]
MIRGLRIIDGGFLDAESSAVLAARLGVSSRHMNRLFRAELGATPRTLAMTRRRGLAKRLIDETDLPLAAVALQAGYGSLRRFNDDVRRCYGRPPGVLRARRRGRRSPRRVTADAYYSLRLPVRAPYHADWVFEFLARRALAGFETVSGRCYRRRVFDADGSEHWIEVRWDGDALHLDVPLACTVPLSDILRRVRRVFDLDADPRAIDAALGDDPLLAEVVREHGGLRVPGAWDGFETTVRAILGQQVSVDRATVLAHKLLDRYGAHCLTSPAALADAVPAEIGMPGRRGQAISLLAAAVADGRLQLDDAAPAADLQAALCAIPGIGPWTAGYVAMRVAKDPDAFPVNDWVVLKVLQSALGEAAALSAARAAAAGRPGSRADGWRPWRAYAVMYLWKLSQSVRAAERRPAPPRATEAR